MARPAVPVAPVPVEEPEEGPSVAEEQNGEEPNGEGQDSQKKSTQGSRMVEDAEGGGLEPRATEAPIGDDGDDRCFHGWLDRHPQCHDRQGYCAGHLA